MQKEKGLAYWIPIVLGTVAVVGVVARGSVRLSDTERKTERIPGMEWDLLLVKSMLSAINPAKYDSVLTAQVRVYGQRPEGDKK